MTKVKVKAAFISNPRSDNSDDDDDENEDEEQHHNSQGNFMPFGKVSTKRKRGPRGSTKLRNRDCSGFQNEGYSDSALATSSSERSDDDGNNEEVGNSVPNHSRDGWGFSPGVDGPGRGSGRLKVKPSKFRDDGLRNAMTSVADVKSTSKRKSTGSIHEQTSSKQHAYYERRQLEHLTDELKAALMVVQKTMKMDAAEPFNIPVDPVALGIPDYFDIVKRPMDLGTICKNLERGGKYQNSRDVYEDVQLVWTNCRIYNQKGDPILDLLARVKKTFMKYWISGGLYTEKSPGSFKIEGETYESAQVGSTDSNIKQRALYEGIDNERNKKTVKVAKAAENVTETNIKPSGQFDKNANDSGSQRVSETVASILNDDLHSYLSNREGPKIISVYRAHKKRKKLEQQTDAKESNVQTEVPRVYEHEDSKILGNQGDPVLKRENLDNEHRSGGHESLVLNLPNSTHEVEIIPEEQGTFLFKNVGASKSQQKKDIDSHVTPGKSRRVSGTGHHKADCTCVVCTGVRRKLAREGKLSSSSNLNIVDAAGSTPNSQEKLFLRVKKEANTDELKVRAGKDTKDNTKAKDSSQEKCYLSEKQGTSKELKVAETDIQSLGAAGFQRFAVTNSIVNNDDGRVAQQSKDNIKEASLSEQSKDNVKEASLSEMKLEGESTRPAVEDTDDAVQNEEQLVDTADAVTEREEGGVRYYRANYDMPPRKMNPAILNMGKRLFGGGTSWNRGLSVGGHSRTNCLENPILASVSMLLGARGTGY